MYISHKNTKVHFEVKGGGSAVVLIHGFLENLTMWKAISETLAKRFKVISIDLLGHGKTENHGYMHTMEDQAETVKAVLDSLKLRKYVLIGHSMGGYVALSFATLFSKNIKGICLLNSSALPDSDEKKKNRDRAIKAVKENAKTFIRIAIPLLFSEKNRAVFKKEIVEITNQALQMTPQGIIAALEGMKIRKNQTKLYKTGSYPIQMIVSKLDPALDYNSLINETKNTKVNVVEFPDGHMSYIENKTEITTTLYKFVKSCF
jgi:pimeloyl-ACP methyl ester carboxylesterase